MKTAFVLVALLGASAVSAGELADADKLLHARDYAQALPIYTELAAAGNPAAQFHLGEMYWYGEGVAVDMAKGDEWFRKAAAAGYPEAKAALKMSSQRQARQGDIDYYLQRYDGADVSLSHFRCGTPEIPTRSENSRDIKEVAAMIDDWQVCYGGFIKNLRAQLPAGKAIPADLSDLMTDAEIQQATARMNQVYAAINAEAKQQAALVNAASDSWRIRTSEYVATVNARTQQLIAEREKDFRVAAETIHIVDAGQPVVHTPPTTQK